LVFLSGFSSVTGGVIEFRRNAGRDIWPTEPVPESDSPQRDKFPILCHNSPPYRGHLAAPKIAARKATRTGLAMGIVEWVVVGMVLVAGALFLGFPFGVAVGYAWRERISRARRARFLTEQERTRARRSDGPDPMAAIDRMTITINHQ
jgi:hypothetical protein